jgi:serine/threonine protein kinase/tetratricopeptide (TPR) repeat protein
MDLRATLQQSLGADFSIERELGGGGMSRVFVVREESLGRDVVLKVLSPELAQGLSAERFTREIKLAAALQEPHIVPVLSAGQTAEGLPFYTMPFVKGDSLRARMSAGRVPLGEAVSVLRDVARALAYAHASGVVHRDIKPENILLSSGTAVVTDFGIAKALRASRTQAPGGTLTQIGTSIGTPAYMAPEQAAGDEATDHRADIYAWGVVAYELLSGAHPFSDKKTPQALLTAHFSETPAPLTASRNAVPASLGALVQRCLEKDPAKRPQSAQEIVQSLDAVRGDDAASARGTRNRVTAIVAAVAVVALAAAAFVILPSRAASKDSADRSVAVIPFENAGGDSTQEYFSDGLTDELIGRLATTGLRVSGRNSAFTFKGKHAAAREVGATLGVHTVLSGRVSRLGDKLHVSAELASATNDSVLWTFNADRRTSDIFAVQQEIVESIVGHFRVSPTRSTIAGDGRTSNLAAHDLYLRGNFRANKTTRDDLLAALATYDSALALDTAYALAWVGKANVYANLADAYVAPNVAYPKGEEAVRRAMALDSTLAESWVAAGNIDALYTWNWARSKAYLDRARAAGLRSSDLWYAEGGYWSGVRRLDKMVEAFDESARLDPLAILTATLRLETWTETGAPDSAIAFWENLPASMRTVPYGEVFYAVALTDHGDYARAEQEFTKSLPALGHPSPGLGVLYARTGRRAQAEKILSDIEASWPASYIAPEIVAQLPAALGDTTTMYKWLERGVKIHSAWATGLWIWKSAFGRYMPQAHYQDILRRIHDSPTPPAS